MSETSGEPGTGTAIEYDLIWLEASEAEHLCDRSRLHITADDLAQIAYELFAQGLAYERRPPELDDVDDETMHARRCAYDPTMVGPPVYKFGSPRGWLLHPFELEAVLEHAASEPILVDTDPALYHAWLDHMRGGVEREGVIVISLQLYLEQELSNLLPLDPTDSDAANSDS